MNKAEAQPRNDLSHEYSPAYLRGEARVAPGAVYGLGMLVASGVGAVLRVVGLEADLSGPAIVLLAAAFPVAGLLWALGLSALSRRRR